ncbi:MAG: leucine--tRNA ligase [Verrucomicrobiota bacterium]|jgi:leucyl-tRNA synthetase
MSDIRHDYDPAAIEPKWQAYWLQNKTFKTGTDRSKPKFYALDMFPYPSGNGLHVGHPEGYTATDIICRYKRMKGFNVLHPMGWDAFGLPAEQYAISTGTHPAITTKKNCDTFRRQIQSLGFSYDWDKELSTTDVGYYKWTQWIFLKLYDTWFDDAAQKGRPIAELPIPAEVSAQGPAAVRDFKAGKRLAYFAGAKVWFCKHCKTVCANEEVLNDGSHEKCGTKNVAKTELKQWQLRIPSYAERLITGLEGVNWPEGIKEHQRNWIGRSSGAEVDFALQGRSDKIRVFTTRPDTLFGATYMVLAPEHELVAKITTAAQQAAVAAYVEKAKHKSDLDRQEGKEKSGVFTGAYGLNPVTGEAIPVWISDYVLMGYGTGAIMAVPAHDERDFAFALSFNLPIKCIIAPDAKEAASAKADVDAVLAGKACWTGNGKLINSNNGQGLALDGLEVKDSKAAATRWLEAKGCGSEKINYKLRDWLFSRQRYWGEPFPVIHFEDGSIETVDASELPVVLPEVANFLPADNGESPLANAGAWLDYTCPRTGRKGRRETNTMPQWAGSCWYYLRYIDACNGDAAWAPEMEKYWMPVDLYVGGAEHAVLHLLYSRFWHKVLFDLNLVSTDEPFQQLFNQGMILAFAYEDKVGSLVPSDEVEDKDGKYWHKTDGRELKQIVAKMSKSLKNVVTPDEIVKEYGADSLRLYEMFMGALQDAKPWQTSGVEGVYGFLKRVWALIIDAETGKVKANIKPGVELSKESRRTLHFTIKKVGEAIEGFGFNTGISQMMILRNEFAKLPELPLEAVEAFVKLVSAFAPHIGEELWSRLGHSSTLAYEPWPVYNEAYLVLDEVEILVQLAGKPLVKLMAPSTLDAAGLEAWALARPEVIEKIAGKSVKKVVAVPGRLVNIIAG